MLSNNNCRIDYFLKQNTYSYLSLNYYIIFHVYIFMIYFIITEIREGVGTRRLFPIYLI